jgi:non-ribosomal peptide synthetase component E (peptide arylation enzyme)
MDSIEKRELKRKAWMRLAAQKRRAGILRGRVVVISLICFTVLWGVVFAQMATGNDPVLSGKEQASSTRSVAVAKREVETTEPRELEPRRRHHKQEAGGVEEVEAEADEEAARIEAEAVEVEPEPLVTSQS